MFKEVASNDATESPCADSSQGAYALNGLDIFGADTEGAYLNAMSREKLFAVWGPELGEFRGQYAVM